MPSKSARKPTERPAITEEAIIDAAVRLTQKHGLERWSMRQLAAELGVYTRVIYWHVGDREDVLQKVSDRALRDLEVPPAEEEWRTWFTKLLTDLRLELRKYPGIAKRFAMYGPGMGTSRTTISRGIHVLKEAGFGNDSAMIYSMVMSQACQFIAQEDERDFQTVERERAAERYLKSVDDPDDGLAALSKSIDKSCSSSENRIKYYDELYELFITIVMNGLAVMLEERNGYRGSSAAN